MNGVRGGDPNRRRQKGPPHGVDRREMLDLQFLSPGTRSAATVDCWLFRCAEATGAVYAALGRD